MDKNFRDRIAAQINEIEVLAGLQPCSSAFNSWRKSTEELLMQAFGNGRELESFNAIFYTPLFLSCRMNDSTFTEAFRKGLQEARMLLEGILRRLSS